MGIGEQEFVSVPSDAVMIRRLTMTDFARLLSAPRDWEHSVRLRHQRGWITGTSLQGASVTGSRCGFGLCGL